MFYAFRLRVMHDRFLNRESREEDVELIETLKQALHEREDFVKTLNVIKILIPNILLNLGDQKINIR